MTAKDIITVLVPLLVALVSGLYAYLQTRKTSGVEGQKLNLAGYESLNKSQADEIERLRADRIEDRKAFDEERDDLRRKLAEVTERCQNQGEKFTDLVRWTRQITRVLNDPAIVRLLAASDVYIPPPPTWPDEP